MRSNIASLIVIATALSAVCLGLPAVAETARLDRIEIVDAGFYSARKTGETKVAPGAVAGTDTILSDVKFLDDAPERSARIGSQFGVRFRSVGRPQDAEVTLRSVWKFPPPGITNPKTGNTFRESVVNFPHRIGTTHVRGYSLDESWEIVRGVWTLQIWQGDRKLFERNFMIE